MQIAAFDLSLTASGWCVSATNVASGSVFEWGCHRPPKGMKDIERIDWIAKRCCEQADGVDLVVIEDRFNSKGAYAKEICGVTYLIRHCLWRRKTSVVLVAPATLKKFATGSGGNPKRPVGKQAVIDSVKANWSIDLKDDNEADAVVLAHIGLALANVWWPRELSEVTKAQREVVAKLRDQHKSVSTGNA